MREYFSEGAFSSSRFLLNRRSTACSFRSLIMVQKGFLQMDRMELNLDLEDKERDRSVLA